MYVFFLICKHLLKARRDDEKQERKAKKKKKNKEPGHFTVIQKVKAAADNSHFFFPSFASCFQLPVSSRLPCLFIVTEH